MKYGVLLLNLGTPDSPTPADVKKYLDEFLMDPYVIDIPKPLRWLLVKGIILNTRPKKSAANYKKVWSSRGSPLLFYSLDFFEGFKKEVQAMSLDVDVRLAMRYGKPSIQTALREMAASGVDRLVLFPLYPQYAESTTRTGLEKVVEELNSLGLNWPLQMIPAFYDHAGFIGPQSRLIRDCLKDKNIDHLLLSYHGLPERHVQKLDVSKSYCSIEENCCDQIKVQNKDCYRAHCVATSKALAQMIGFKYAPNLDFLNEPRNAKSKTCSLSFQSRLGRAKWLEPMTSTVVEQLAQQGIKSLAVACPSFVADCLETLEEAADQIREVFISNGGKEFFLIPCLNGNPDWIKSAVEMTTPYFLPPP